MAGVFELNRLDGEVTSFETALVEIHTYAASYIVAKGVSVVDADWRYVVVRVEIPARFIVDTRSATKCDLRSDCCNRVCRTQYFYIVHRTLSR